MQRISVFPELLDDIESAGLRKRFCVSSARSKGENIDAKTSIGNSQLMYKKNITFEERHPLPDAPPARRIRMRRLLKQRNQGLRRPNVGHVYIGHKIDYRIEPEKNQEEKDAVQDDEKE
jgi:hypothetical protein